MIPFKAVPQLIQLDIDYLPLSSCELDRQAQIASMLVKWRSDLERATKAHHSAGKRIGASTNSSLEPNAQAQGGVPPSASWRSSSETADDKSLVPLHWGHDA